MECCDVQLESKFSSIYILATDRAPTGDFELFLNKLEGILNYLYKPKADFIICGDIILLKFNTKSKLPINIF